MTTTRFVITRDLLDEERRGELENWIQQHTCDGSSTREVLERIDRLPLAPVIDHLVVTREPHAERHLGGYLWHWRVQPARRGIDSITSPGE